MADRRKKRGRRNRGRFGFLYKVLSALLIAAAIMLGCVVFFRVNTIVVTGYGRYSEAEVIAASGVERGDNLFRLDKYGIYKRILVGLPYVDEISISRKLPDTLLIQVTESKPVAYLVHNGEYWLMDAKCKLLERGDATLAQGFAQVLGLTPLAPTVGKPMAVDQTEQLRLTRLEELLAALRAEYGMTGSLSGFIDLRADNEIRFGYGERLTVVFPMSGDFAGKAFALRCTLETMDQRMVERAGTLDLTYGDDKAHLLSQQWLPEQQTQPEIVPDTTEEQGDSDGTTDNEAEKTPPQAAAG